jgi:hypothetical protein
VSTGGLSLTCGVTANHVIYNFTGASGSISAQVSNVLAGTLLAPNYSISNGDGSVIGEIIASGSIQLLSASRVNAGSKFSNTATVTGSNVSSANATSTIDINTPAQDIPGLSVRSRRCGLLSWCASRGLMARFGCTG